MRISFKSIQLRDIGGSMREIIFRGKVNKLPECGADDYPLNIGNWVYGYYVYCERVVNGKRISFHTIHTKGTLCPQVDSKTVGQFIDLKDKNGKKIYEGDILKDRNGRIGEVISAYGSYWFYPFEMVLVSDMNVLCEIIGNIHDNPELLESSKCKP